MPAHQANLNAAIAAVLLSALLSPVSGQSPSIPSAPTPPPPAPASLPERAGTDTAVPTTDPQDDATKKRHSRLRFGVDVGTFLPTSGKTRDRFGGSWETIGLGVGGLRQAVSKGRISFDFTTISKYSGDKHAFFAPVGVEYRRALVQFDPANRPQFIPYAGVAADLVFVDLRSPDDGVHSGFRATGGGRLFLGTTIGERGFAEARYLGIGTVKGFNLSGFSLSAGVRF